MITRWQCRINSKKRIQLFCTLLYSFAYKVCVDKKFTKPTVVFRGENAVFKFIEAILKEYEYCKKVMKNILTKI